MNTPDATEELFQAALGLPENLRAELADRLLLSLGGPGKELPEGVSWEDAWRDEIRRRSDELHNGTAKLVTWEEARARWRATIERIRAEQDAPVGVTS